MKTINWFLSYELVEADLLVCMPALGDRIKVRFDEINKTLRAYIIVEQHPINPTNLITSINSKKQLHPISYKIN